MLSISWDASLEGKKTLDENGGSLSSRNAAEVPETEAETAPRADGNRDKVLIPPEDASTNSSLRSGLNVTTAPIARRRVNGGDRSRKKRRRGKESKGSVVDRQREVTEEGRENEIRRKRGGQSKKSKDSPARRYRAERRRRRKNRERKRGRKRTRPNDEKANSRRNTKFRRRMNDAPAALLFGEPDGQMAQETNLNSSTWKSNPSLSNGPISDVSDVTSPSSNLQDQLTTEASRRSPQTTTRYRTYEDTVEKEFSKQLEKEILRTQMEDPASLENRILGSSLTRPSHKNIERKWESSKSKTEGRFGGSRYDAEKMLGYSKTKEDLPILDLENEVLARTLKDYNAYMASSLKLSMLSYRDEIERHKSPRSRAHGKPIIDGTEFERLAGKMSTETPATTVAYVDDTMGDLSCINGTFVPAPLVRHALIKYVKSSIPGHEYLEADYECAPGYYMVTRTNRLLCRKREWIGQLPKCKIKQVPEGVCIDASCDQICKEVDAKPVCSCYKGFRLEDNKCVDVNECKDNEGGCEHKCVNTPGFFRCECPKGLKLNEDRFSCRDINECLLNNGHGPCQDTCRNTIGGYECSCDGLLDTVLSPDNHSCQDAGPCSVNNAGCSHTCLSTMGRVFCLCPDGFILEDDWKTCQDVDECVQPDLQTEMCRYGCINTPGSYRCAEPMELKDQPILDSLSITCLPGYEATPDGTCIDINECQVDNGGCTEVCENTDGSFFCACDGDEKALSSDGKSCVDLNNVSCPPLNPEGRGHLVCFPVATSKTWRGRRRLTSRPGFKCFLQCPRGYQLHGEYELTCRSDGTWDGPKHGECVRYSKPRLECPKDVIAELPPGRDEAFVTFDQPSTDLDWFRYVRSKPSWGTRLEANLAPGVHEITFFARHPVSKKQASCVLRIIVKGGEAPKVKDCPNDIEVTGKNGSAITWTEPIFTDNVKVTRIRSNESPGRRFDVGGHRIEYEASDEAGWSSKCVFTVVLRQE
ncbi:Matrilin-2 [Dufourea novaeangliae]|uniref:Matrilin-2 n=1 Tax=Dufourea novaeangliae TaxID=178035 RepID=A0A154P0D8_DUFNO|nr:Matrilin-2 [Dufourea novaeangliae]